MKTSSRIISKSYRQIIGPYTQGLISAVFSRSFLIENCCDENGIERKLDLQLNNQGEEIRDFTPMGKGLGLFIANGFNQIWYRNLSEYTLDFNVLVSQDVIENTSITGTINIQNLLDSGDNPIPVIVKNIKEEEKPLPETKLLELHDGDVLEVTELLNTIFMVKNINDWRDVTATIKPIRPPIDYNGLSYDDYLAITRAQNKIWVNDVKTYIDPSYHNVWRFMPAPAGQAATMDHDPIPILRVTCDGYPLFKRTIHYGDSIMVQAEYNSVLQVPMYLRIY